MVVSRGRTGVPSSLERENLRGVGAKIEYVPVPVLYFLLINDRGLREGNKPVWAMFADFDAIADEIEVLVFLMAFV